MLHEHHLTVGRTARYYSLGDMGGAPTEVWIACHGYGQLAERFLRQFEPFAGAHRLFVAPEGLSRFYVDAITEHRKVGASWMTREDRLSEIADYLRFLDAVHDEIFERVDRERASLTVLGFSQGAATASRWALQGHARVDRLVLWAGLLPPEVRQSAADAAKLRAMRLTLVLGDRDSLAQEEALAPQRAALAAAGIPCEMITFAGGHEIEAQTLRDLAVAGAGER